MYVKGLEFRASGLRFRLVLVAYRGPLLTAFTDSSCWASEGGTMLESQTPRNTEVSEAACGDRSKRGNATWGQLQGMV